MPYPAFVDVLTPSVIWGLIPRLVGALFAIAMGSMVPQILALGGERGLFPIGQRLTAHARHFPGPRRFLDHPTLFWFSTHPTFLRAVPLVGALAGLVAMYGGELSFWALLVAWICLLSLDVLGLVFPWDCMLLEAGFLVLFLPHPEALPSLEASSAPLPLVTFMFRWLVVRLMWGFAKLKFIGTEKSDRLYLQSFFTWLPVPSPAGWWAQHMPRWALVASLHFMFFAEVVAPGLALIAGPARLVGACALIGLMIGIHVTGNWGFFNVGYIFLSLSLFDLHASVIDDVVRAPLENLWATPQVAAVNATMVLMFGASLLHFASNSWVNRVWMHWCLDDLIHDKRWAKALVAVFRFFSPLRALNGYGVFQPNSIPPIRLIPVIEGSNDGETWLAYDYKYMPSKEHDPPPVVAPHHPRLDHAVHYGGMGVTDHSILGSLIGDGTPTTSYTRYSWLDRLLQHVLRGDPEILGLLKTNPFPDAPPKLARMSTYALRTASVRERRRSGRWWHRRRVGTLVNPTGLDDDVLNHWVPIPELFHPDWAGWKERAPALRAIRRAHAEGAHFDQAILVGSDLTSADVEGFWEQFVPFVAEQRGDWQGILTRVDAFRARFSHAERVTFERILERLCWLLRVPLEPHMYGGKAPALPKISHFRFHLLQHEIVLDGREALEATLRDPGLATARFERATDETALYALALLRYEVIEFHVRVFRWGAFGDQIKRRGGPGIVEFYDLLTAIKPRGESWRPEAVKHPDGAWTVYDFEPDPEPT